MKNSLRAVLEESRSALAEVGISNYQREAEWIIEDVTGCSRAEIILDSEQAITASQTQAVADKIRRRTGGEPLQYILGSVEFRDHRLEVGPGVLIPRPETEQLVELASRFYPGKGAVCDLCTGSGAIAIALASVLKERRLTPDIFAVDISRTALEYAADNIRYHQFSNIHLLQADLLTAFSQAADFSMICVNPPYVPQEEFSGLPAEVKDYEPALALTGGQDGLAIIRTVLTAVPSFLARESGVFICEIGESQAEACRKSAQDAGFKHVTIKPDYSGRARFLTAGGRT